jgi:hypothetical protein
MTLLGTEHSTDGTRERSQELVTVIHREDAIKTTAVTKAEKGIDRFSLVSWLFVIGSLIFTFDSGLEFAQSISLHSVFHDSPFL